MVHIKERRDVTMPFSRLRKIKDWRDSKAPKDITNFPGSGDNQKITLSNSKFPQFPDFDYVKDLKENYPKIWRRAGTGGNPPTSFTGNDAFRNWSKYKLETEVVRFYLGSTPREIYESSSRC